ncbi:MAG: hypothetical protein FJ253_09075 [Phycisphaerae bacterium]|nr:hypothetical protein [Phycisphaerae bacterium]
MSGRTHHHRVVVAATTGSFHLMALAPLLLLAACGAPPRPSLDAEQFRARAAEQKAATKQTTKEAVAKLMARIERDASNHRPVINILAISGGGDWGAFGSGFLRGWGECADTAKRRPDFDVVTGVSTGSLIAPFAFINTDEAILTVDEIYRNPSADWVESHGMLSIMPWNPSFVTIDGLRKTIDDAASPEFIRTLAQESSEGKVLLVAATDLDLGCQQVWDVGEAAELAVAAGDTRGITDYVFASSAIPVAFPSIMIDPGLYADGCLTANVLLRLDARSPEGFVRRWREVHPDQPLPSVRYWIIINNQLAHIPKTVQRRWADVLGPALDVSMRSGTIAQVQLLASQADFVNAALDGDVEVRLVAIPDDWRPPVEGLFKQETMRSLSDLGRRMGEDPNSWQLWAAPQLHQPAAATAR